MKPKKLRMLLWSSVFCLSACSMGNTSLEKHTMTSTTLGFDTAITFTAYTESEAEFEQYAAIVKEQFTYYHRLFDRYESYDGITNIQSINDAAGKAAVQVDDAIIELLTEAKRLGEMSDGAFDVTMGAVLEIWHQYREVAEQAPKQAAIPSQQELEEADRHSGWDKVSIDADAKTVALKDEKMSLDVGGIAKGYAVEQTAQALEKAGLTSGFLNAGGNVRLIGKKPQEEAWAVGVQLPQDDLNVQSLATLTLSGPKSIVTSGDYQRYYLYEDMRMHHIIDPKTLQPSRQVRSVTVVCEDSTLADVLSTALFTLSQTEGEALLQKIEKETGMHADAIWIYDDTTPFDEEKATVEVQGYTLIVDEALQDIIDF